MPAYDYRCIVCDERFEVTRAIGESSPVACPACGGDTKRVFTPVGVVFKGSGFHNTDYRPKKESSSSEGASSCPAASGGSCDSCPAGSD